MPASGNVPEMLREAAALRAAGRFAEAAAAYESVLALAPALPDSWFNLAWLQRRLGEPDAALASYQQALDRGVSGPEEVRLNRAVIFADDLRQDDAAERELRQALVLNPGYKPALLNLANLEEDRGRRAEAAALYDRILALDPTYWEALARSANCRAFSDPAAPLIGKLEAALARGDVAAADRASLGFALGRALDAVGRYDDAFAAYAAANEASRASAAPGQGRYDPAALERFVDAVIAAFASPAAAAALEAKPPIFICGMFRSGSTLIEQVLSSHPRVTAGGEMAFLPGVVAGELSPFPAAVAAASAGQLEDIARRYLDAVARTFPGADLVTDKRPDNFLFVGLIKTLFPRAKIIHTTRHPLDNCLSAYFLHLDHGMAYALDLIDTGHFYRQQRRLMAHWRALYGDDVYAFDYDAFVQDPRAALEPLLAFCGLDWNDALLSFHARESSVKTASVWQVREPLYRRASGRWRHYAAHLAPLRAYLRDLLPADERG
jgi:tetratricopeptide (TPR) repeat protein